MDMMSRSLVSLFGALSPESLADIRSRIEVVDAARGEEIYRQGEPANGMHILLSGRLQVRVRGEDNGERVIAYIPPGESVGETALFTGAPRSATVAAARDSTLAYLGREVFDEIMERHPQVALHLSRSIIARLTATQASRRPDVPMRNITVVPVTKGFPIQDFARRLQLSLLRFGRTAHLNSSSVRDLSGGSQEERSGLRADHLLDAYERDHDHVIYQADATVTEWTKKCLGYSDKVLLVADANGPADLCEIETGLLGELGATAPNIALVLVHRDSSAIPSGAKRWLGPRRVDRHYHLAWHGHQGFDRLARLLSCNAVTLVLGGGGARGFAHIGVVRALREACVPIDAVGGTSFGALVAAEVALGRDDEQILSDFKAAFVDQQVTNDYTVPVVSLMRGEKMERTIERFFGTHDIEDLWVPFLALSTNLSRNRKMVHTHGRLSRALRASVSLPAIFPPVLEDRDLLIDGGLLDNLPVDEMKEWAPGKCIAVDLSVNDEFQVDEEAMPSALEILKAKILPYGKTIRIPTMDRLLMKATTLGSRREAERARRAAHLYLAPPVSGFDLLNWDRFYDIVEVGYQYAKENIEAWLSPNRDEIRRESFVDTRLTWASADGDWVDPDKP